MVAPTQSCNASDPCTFRGILDGPNGQVIFDTPTLTDQLNVVWAQGGTRRWAAYLPNSSSDLRFYSQTTGDVMILTSSGKIGIGVLNPDTSLTLLPAGFTDPIQIGDSGCGSAYPGITFSPTISCTNYSLLGDGKDTFINRPSGGVIRFREANVEQVAIAPGGDVVARGRVIAQKGFNGTCTSSPAVVSVKCNQDVAEAFASTEPTEPGDLVVLVAQAGPEPTVRKSVQPYEGLLAGVTSTNPGLVFDYGQTFLAGDNSKLVTQDKTIVAVVGRVELKVSLENGSIAVGDPLTSSSKPGVAMKATKAGKIIGYALESADRDGKILIWLQPGMFIPDHLLEQLNQLQRN
ncbi:hypothetical protein HYR54_15610 [Candidatus Acetothermia bacterium]|nr:hypothetical protein [Candidatus Acetothermia bacterium]